jgi:hypothetical protein
MSDPLIPLSDVNFALVTHEEPAKVSLYLKAGAPTCCFNPRCKKHFEGFCVRRTTTATTALTPCLWRFRLSIGDLHVSVGL